MARLEHANITVMDAAKTAAWLGRAFGWAIRWEGSVMNGDGYTVHVGSPDDYLALYQPRSAKAGVRADYVTFGQLNHVGIVVDDLAKAEKAVRSEGYEPHSHQEYEPGARFIFLMKTKLNMRLLRMIEGSVGASPHRLKGRFPRRFIWQKEA